MASYVQKGNGAATPVPEGAAPGFALVAVLVLTIMIMALVPMMLTLNRENISGVQGDQVRARVGEQARQMFMIGHASMQMNAGLPQGWQQASAAPADDVAMLVNCSGFLDRDDEAWNTEDARISMITITDNTAAIDGTRLATGFIVRVMAM